MAVFSPYRRALRRTSYDKVSGGTRPASASPSTIIERALDIVPTCEPRIGLPCDRVNALHHNPALGSKGDPGRIDFARRLK
jgi:hypothetical protein